MNIYALIPLFATVAYIPLLVTTISSRPWQRQQKLFVWFLIAAIMWSLSDFFLRSEFLQQYTLTLGKLIMIMYTWMVVQFYCFVSSFYPQRQGRWLPFAYVSLVTVIAIVIAGYLPRDIVVSGSKHYPDYGPSIIVLMVPLLTLAVRSVYVLWKRLTILGNPVIYNQIVSLLLTIFVMTIFSLAILLPWGNEFPVVHLGNIINAFILSYAAVGHELVDIRLVLRRGLAWISLGLIGAVCYWLLLVMFNILLRFEIDLTATFIATAVAIIVAILIYKLRSSLFVTLGKAFQGPSYDYRQRLYNFADKIHNVFSLREQGGELLTLVTKAVNCKKAGLLFREVGSEDFTTQLVEPKETGNPLSNLRLRGRNPLSEYLEREDKLLTREQLAILPELRSLWEQEKEEIESSKIELWVPLISRDRLIGILVLDNKQSGRYTLEDFTLLEDVTNRVAVSMEKEYLREQLKEREEELAVINRSSAIMTSSLDIQRIYDSFIQELKKVVDVSWAAIALIEENEIHFLALSSEIGSAWQAGERIPIKGTATEWVAAHRKAIIEPDLSLESRFVTGKYHLRQGVRSIAYLPLIIKEEVIGSLIVANRHSNAYSQRHINLLEQLASQIAMPIENSRLYAKAEQMARIDELTGLLNRRSLDKMITSEIGRHSRYGGIFSIIVLDLDSFKAFNDNYGHLAGDELLKQTGSIMKSTIRDADQAFRYGGDEFAILLPQTPIDAAKQVAERVRQQVASKMKVDYISVTASLGLSSWPADGLGANDIMASADMALYHAKRSGGNQSYCVSETLLSSDDTMVKSRDIQDSEGLSTLYALAAVVDARDHYTHSHSKRVNEYAVAMAEALNLEPLEISRLSTCALLHDIGKIVISDEILTKPGKLNEEEWEAIKTHPKVGATIASHARHLAPCIPGIMHHHEKYDGSGYPEDLKGEEIPLEARILAIADAFAAMTSDRHYCDALPSEKALEEIRQGAGKQFDPNLVKVFMSVVKTTSVATTARRNKRK